MQATLSLPTFIARWKKSALGERQAAQSHFNDLCHLLGKPSPTEADPKGEFFAFEKGATKSTGGEGFADVWYKDHFAWEYKGKHKNLEEAYKQLLKYHHSLDFPHLLVVCDTDRFEINTAFNGTPRRTYRFGLSDLAESQPIPGHPLSPLEMLHALFENPEALRPDFTTSQATEEVAAEFAKLAASLQRYGTPPDEAAHFLVRLLFCLFAQDIGLLPEHLFTQLVDNTRKTATAFTRQLRDLFQKMATGGYFGPWHVPYFDGGLFADDKAIDLASDDLEILSRACKMNWADVEPAIFGTLFERSLNESKRSQIGAHYTSKEDVLLVVEPVLMAPLRREWAQVQAKALDMAAAMEIWSGPARDEQGRQLQELLSGFADRLATVQVLDPACGSGNFLYVALKQMLGLEKEAIAFATSYGLPGWHPKVSPSQLHGIEIDPYAHELAQVVIWIGYLQWMRDNGFPVASEPVLSPLDNVLQIDAILSHDSHGWPKEPEWPAADVIIGNPPFLGGKLLRKNLGDQYVDQLFTVYEGRVPREADLVCHWFEKARAAIADGKVKRAGLLVTQGIRGGANRKILERIKESGDIFMAWSDRPWILDGAAVRVSIVGFDNGAEAGRLLDGAAVERINPNLTGALNLTAARRLPENFGLCFMGDTKGGPFDISADVAAKMLAAPLNPNGRPNSDVVRQWVNGLDITRRNRGMWIIDFGVNMPEEQAALYELPFGYVQREVMSVRAESRTTRLEWWLHERPRVDMRLAIEPLPRYIGTARVAKHRLFAWLSHPTLPDSALIVFARNDDYFFGILHSKVHELWALRMGTALEDRPRYTPTTTFETFPLPWPPEEVPKGDPLVQSIADAAADLVAKRDAWLNPPGVGEKDLKDRTLTNLYNRRPEWLRIAHRNLDEAVLDAYGWPHDLPDDQILARLLALNLERSNKTAPSP